MPGCGKHEMWLEKQFVASDRHTNTRLLFPRITLGRPIRETLIASVNVV